MYVPSNWKVWLPRYKVSVTCPHLDAKMSCPLTLIRLRFWARAESACFFRCFPYVARPESWGSAGCLTWELELRVILVTGAWGAFLSQLDLDLFIPAPVDSEKKYKLSLNETSLRVYEPECFPFFCAISLKQDLSKLHLNVRHENYFYG